MALDTLIEDQRWKPVGLSALAAQASEMTLAHLGLAADAFEISLLACNDARIAELNADFRGKPQPTNVLSWPSQERGAQKDGDMPQSPEVDPHDLTELGDIAIAYETCVAEANSAEKPLYDHCAHLLVHGTLHLLGFDHERDQDATLMEGIETEILGKLGIKDPYGK